MISFEQARACLSAAVRPLSTERVALSQADGRVTAGAIHSQMDLPPFDNSAMDGYVLKYADTLTVNLELDVTGEQAAGDTRAAGVGAWEIMTGARVPDGFDTVVPVEDTHVLRRNAEGRPARIRLEAAPHRGQHVRLRGQDIAAGECAVPAGTWVDASVAMLLGGIGVADLAVHRRPRIALLCTGRELVDAPGTPLASGQIYNTNGPFLARRLLLAGAEIIDNRTIADDPAVFRDAVLAAEAAGADLIVSTGAVSMGRYDFVPEVLHELDATLLFHKVRMRPGKPLLAATLPSGVLCIGLPGNPVSSAVGERFFIEALLRRMLGMSDEQPWRLPLAAQVHKKAGFAMLQKAALELDGNGQVRVRLLAGQESFRTRPLLDARVWALLPEAAEALAEGCLIDVFPLGHIDSTLIRKA
jgi:molybdopterin molybdotransferase